MAVTLSLSIAQNSQNITNNTSNVTVTVKCSWTGGSYNALVAADGTPQPYGTLTIDGTNYDFRSTFNVNRTTTGSQTLFTKTVNISHSSNGTKTLACSASFNTRISSSGTITASASKALTTIPRKSTLSVGNGTLGTALTLTVTRQATSFSHTITAKCGSASTTVCTKSTSTSISFTPPLDWAKQNTTGTSVSVTYTITTYNGSTSVGGNAYTKTCSIPASVKPSCTVTVSDASGHLSTYGAYIKGCSKFKVDVAATTIYDSPISAYKTTANGSTSTKASFTTGVLLSSGTLTISSTVTDKRNRTSDAAKVTVTVLDYSAPNINKFSVGRCDDDGSPNDQGDYVKVTYGYTFVSLNNKNTAAHTIKYKKSSETETAYSSEFSSVGVDYVIFAADGDSSYDVLISVTDDLETSTKITSVSTAFTIMHWKASGYGMAIGKISELDGVFDIGMRTRMLGGILHPVLEPETDLDDVLTPNTYVGADISSNNYGHCPLTSGTFTLEVVGMGEEGQVKQRLTYCHKTLSKAWERIYYGSSWGEWICVSDFDGQLLWSGGYYMTANHRAELAEPISRQRSGIVLVFSRYSSGTAQDYHFQTFFVPKMQIAKHTGCGHTFMMTTDGSFGLFAAKYLYINDESIVGNEINNASGTGNCGITYDNAGFVLRYVIGV